MTREQFLLNKLAEECAEVIQRALKQAQYGAEQIQTGNEVKDGVAAPIEEAGLTNAQRLNKELIDLGVICDLLTRAKQLPNVAYGEEEWEEIVRAKVGKLNKYLAFSRQLGEIGGDWTV